MLFSNLDIFIVGFYCVGIIILAQYVSRSQQGVEKTAEEYFLAGRSLPWWAIGASLIACKYICRTNYWHVWPGLRCWYGNSNL
jgi:Na+/proline symporter